ncbi:MAG: molybdenum cofactor guanylyltransferase [Sphingobium sp.]
MILGVILAGGRSDRFGSDKARALWRGISLIDHVRDRLATVTRRVIVCGGAFEGYEVIADPTGPALGPLGGLASALDYAYALGFERIVTAPCDTPVLDDILLAALVSAETDAFLGEMPVIGSWRTSLHSRLASHLANEGNRSMRRWIDAIDAVAIDLPAPPNINRRSDLDALNG